MRTRTAAREHANDRVLHRSSWQDNILTEMEANAKAAADKKEADEAKRKQEQQAAEPEPAASTESESLITKYFGKYATWTRKKATKGKHIGRWYLMNPEDKYDRIWEVCANPADASMPRAKAKRPTLALPRPRRTRSLKSSALPCPATS